MPNLEPDASPPGASAHDTAIRASFPYNMSWIISWEILWGFATPCCMLPTILPAYLQYLGAPKTLIQTVCAACGALAVCALWSGKLIHGPRRKLMDFLCWIGFSAGWLAYGLLALPLFSLEWRWMWISLFSVMALAICFFAAIGTPSSEEMTLQNTPLHRRGRLSALRSLGLGLSGLGGIWFAVWLFKLWPTPTNYHARFVIGSIILGLSCICVLLIRDHAALGANIQKTRSIRADTRKLIGNFNFRILLILHALLMAAQSLSPLMLTYGHDHLGMQNQADYFTAAWFAGVLVFGVAVPTLADRFGFKLIGAINAAFLMVAFLCPIVAGQCVGVLLLGYMLYGACCILTMFVLPNLGAEMVPEMRPATIYALGTAITVPLSMIVAPLAGLLVDLLGRPGYIGAFTAGATLCLCSVLGFVFIIREPRTGQPGEVCIRRV